MERSSLLVYLIINSLFIIKYTSRVNILWGILGILLYILFLVVIIKNLKKNKYIVLVCLISYSLIAGIGVPLLYPLGSINVDRWDMIQVFCSSIEKGVFPYSIHGETSYNLPAQSPFYFILCYPFYLLKYYVGIPLVSIWIWWIGLRYIKAPNADLTAIILLTSPIFNYEVISCSTIFFNSVIVFMWVNSFKNYETESIKFFLINGFIGGLLLATRNSYIIPVIMMGIHMLIYIKYKIKPIVWSIGMILSFILVFMPFIWYWGTDVWFENNPFKVQREVILPVSVMIFLIIGTSLNAFKCKNWNQVIFYSGIWLFLSALMVLIFTSIRFDFITAFINSRADITYFILCIPFILFFINSNSLLYDKK